MKNYYTLILSLILMNGTALVAQSSRSALQLSLPRGGYYIITLDGFKHSPQSGSLSLDGISPGYHSISAGYYQGTGRYRRFVNLYNGSLYLEANIRHIGQLDQNGRLRIVRRENMFCDPYSSDKRCGNDQGYAGHYGANGNNHGWNDRFMSSTEFENLKNLVKKKSFDSDKVLIAKQGARSGRLSSAQTREFCELFLFESNKLSFAKTAYDYSRDQQNYYLVNEAFNFSSSIRELEEYISASR